MSDQHVLERPPSASPAFSVNESAEQITQKLWFDGKLIDPTQLQVTLGTHALHYGSGVFEGIRAYATKRGTAVFRLPEHLERMRKGAEALGMTFDVKQATTAVLEVLRHNRLGDAYVRPLAWYGDGGFGLDVDGKPQHFMVATAATNLHLCGTRSRVSVSSWRRNPADSLPPLKICGAYVNSILAKREAKAKGFDEALFVDRDGFVVECTGANLFMVRAGKITAVEHVDALPGITRDTIISMTGAESRRVSLEELLNADEVFACGTAAEVAPISEINEQRFNDHNPISSEIVSLYADAVRGVSHQSHSWLTEV